MQNREQILKFGALAALAVWVLIKGIVPIVKTTFVDPVNEAALELETAQSDLELSDAKVSQIKFADAKVQDWQRRSLPPDPVDAQRLYQTWLTELATNAGISELHASPGQRNSRTKVYTSVQVLLDGKARLKEVSRFLYEFYRTDLPHRIVAISLESPKPEGDPELTVKITAEGLAFKDAAPRAQLFPQTMLAGDFSSSSKEDKELTVDSADGFPKNREFRVRIDDEYLTVSSIDGTTWQVRGGADDTKTGRHKKGDLVRLAPVSPQFALTLDDFDELVKNSLFVKYVPRSTPRGPIARSDGTRETYLRGIVTAGESKLQAWLEHDRTKQTTVIQKGSRVHVGDVNAVVASIEPHAIILDDGKARWKLGLGDNLASMEKLKN